MDSDIFIVVEMIILKSGKKKKGRCLPVGPRADVCAAEAPVYLSFLCLSFPRRLIQVMPMQFTDCMQTLPFSLSKAEYTVNVREDDKGTEWIARELIY